ncbi:MAG: hypothetical protein WCP85_09415 [Mariniphaga sp.]
MLKNLKQIALFALALTIPIPQITPLFAMPTSTKIILGTTATSISTTVVYGYILYKKEAKTSGHKATFTNYCKHLWQLVKNKEARAEMHKTHPKFIAFVAANSALLTLSMGKLIKDRYFTNTPTEPTKTPDAPKIDPTLLAPPTKPFSQLTLEERGERMEAQRKTTKEEPLSYNPKEKSLELTLDFKRPESGWTQEEIDFKKEEYKKQKAALFKISLENDAQWVDRMNEAADADGMPPVEKFDSSTVTKEQIINYYAITLEKLEAHLNEQKDPKQQLKILQRATFNGSPDFKKEREKQEKEKTALDAIYKTKLKAYQAAQKDARAKIAATKTEEIKEQAKIKHQKAIEHNKKKDEEIKAQQKTANEFSKKADQIRGVPSYPTEEETIEFWSQEKMEDKNNQAQHKADIISFKKKNPAQYEQELKKRRNELFKTRKTERFQDSRKKLLTKKHDEFDVPVEILEPKEKEKKA